MVSSKLSRAKGELTKSVGYLLRQVRCLLFETTGDDMLARELARIKADPTNQLEEKVDELTEEVDDLKVTMHRERGLSRWKSVLMQVSWTPCGRYVRLVGGWRAGCCGERGRWSW